MDEMLRKKEMQQLNLAVSNTSLIHNFIDSCRGHSLDEFKESAILYWENLKCSKNQKIDFELKSHLANEINFVEKACVLPRGSAVLFIEVITETYAPIIKRNSFRP